MHNGSVILKVDQWILNPWLLKSDDKDTNTDVEMANNIKWYRAEVTTLWCTVA